MRINLSEFKGKDFKSRIDKALEFLKEHKKSTLVIDPGEYVLTTELAKKAQENVMNGSYGDNPELVMFRPSYVYDRGFDFDGHNGSRIEAYGVKIIVDGFMEPISIRNCNDVEVLGLTLDTLRRPYSRGTIVSVNNDIITVSFGENYPITENIPYMRNCLADKDRKKFENQISLDGFKYIDDHTAEFNTRGATEELVGKAIYLWHTFHSRPAILINNAKNTYIKDVTVHSHPGMGITAMHATNIKIDRYKNVPAPGECMSTNTDATHFASCRGKISILNSLFIGQGDDTVNCHTYYHNILSADGNVLVTNCTPPTGTHTQEYDYFEVGDTIELTNIKTLTPLETYKVVSTELRDDGSSVTVLDKPFKNVDFSEYVIDDKSSLPELEVINCTMKDHFARGLLIKNPKAVVKNCTIDGVFELAIKIAPEIGWREGITTDDILISGCKFINCGRVTGLCGGVHIYTESEQRETEKPHKKIRVENCEIICPDTKYALILLNVEKVELENNILVSKDKEIITEYEQLKG